MTTPSMISNNTLDLRLVLRRVPIVPEGACLTEDTLLSLARDDLDPVPPELWAHLDSCGDCVTKCEATFDIVVYLRTKLTEIFNNPGNWHDKPATTDARAATRTKPLKIGFLEYSIADLPKVVLITVSSDNMQLAGETICVKFVSIPSQNDEQEVFPDSRKTGMSGKFIKNPSGTKTICRIPISYDDWNSLNNQNLKIRFALGEGQ